MARRSFSAIFDIMEKRSVCFVYEKASLPQLDATERRLWIRIRIERSRSIYLVWRYADYSATAALRVSSCFLSSAGSLSPNFL